MQTHHQLQTYFVEESGYKLAPRYACHINLSNLMNLSDQLLLFHISITLFIIILTTYGTQSRHIGLQGYCNISR